MSAPMPPANAAPVNPAIAATFRPPVMEARRWLDGVTFPPDRPLINVGPLQLLV